MGILHLNINRREYTISCEDGEEQHLLNLSYDLDKRVRDLSRVVGTGNQPLLLVVSAIQMLDELYHAKTAGVEIDQNAIQQEIDRISSVAISQMTDRIEDMADKLERKA